jgi:signal peptidase I
VAAGEHARRAPWRDNLEAMTMAIVMALVLKIFVVEAYKIPTGSMQPTLIGDENAGIQDRILVDKLVYALRDPRRWEVAVFRYPLNRAQNFVKRIVGIGPEELRIHDGDLWRRADPSEAWTILRRPRDVQQDLWKELGPTAPDESPWTPEDPRVDWTCGERAIRARGPGRAAFRFGEGAIVDRYFDGYAPEIAERVSRTPRESGENTVGDLRVAGTISARPGTESLTIELREGLRRYRFEIPGPAATAEARPRIVADELGTVGRDGDGTLAEASEPWRLFPGEPLAFGAQNLDDLLELDLDGRVVASLEIPPALDQDAYVHLELAGDGAELDDLAVSRDIYYLDRGTSQVVLPAGSYFMLGDNTQDSADGREWRLRRYEIRADSSPLRGEARDGENPRVVGYGDADGAKLVFRDEWGERHWMRLGEMREMPPEDVHFVPRELVLGRALAVFWPIDPLHGIVRLKWVR